jgi:hypothetical protein
VACSPQANYRGGKEEDYYFTVSVAVNNTVVNLIDVIFKNGRVCKIFYMLN